MKMSPRNFGLVMLAMLVGAIAWSFWRPSWAEVAEAWLTQEIPWLARLLGAHSALLACATCWAVLREPRCGPDVLVLCAFGALVTLLELRPGLLLGLALALLATVALVARPWPNRAIMARCMALAGFAVGVGAVAGTGTG